MQHSTGELRGQAAGKPTAMAAVPEHLVEDPLVVGRIQGPQAPKLHQQTQQQEQASREPNPTSGVIYCGLSFFAEQIKKPQ